MYTLSNGKDGRTVATIAEVGPAAEELQGGDPSVRVTIHNDATGVWLVAPEGETHDTIPAPKANSTWTVQIIDTEAKARIEAQHDAARAAGFAVDPKKQLYATGTRMADVGYATQEARRVEHEQKELATSALAALEARIASEKRRDRIMSAGDLAKSLASNGRITAGGFRLGEQAIRGICARIESPSLSYLLGVRDRVVERAGARAEQKKLAEFHKGKAAGAEAETAVRRLTAAIHEDNSEIVQVLGHELTRDPSISLKLRTREGLGDVFAVVSPTYGEADFPTVKGDIVQNLPSGARATWAYDPISTSWEVRVDSFSLTPIDAQAVGEIAEAYLSVQSKDNGTSSVDTGGGLVCIRCLNASTYVVDGRKGSRIHRGRVVRDLAKMIKEAASGLHVLCNAWGAARESALEVPSTVTIEQAIPGFWRSILKDPRGELAGVLPGKSKEHVRGLSEAFFSERRDSDRLVRSDLAQGWTRYIQGQETAVRRAGEVAIADWLVKPGKLTCDVEGVKS